MEQITLNMIQVNICQLFPKEIQFHLKVSDSPKLVRNEFLLGLKFGI